MSFDTDNRVQIVDYSVHIPDRPKKDKDYFNYKLPVSKQKFKRLIVPPDLKTVSIKAQEDYVDRMYHRRKHGEWWLIKDQPIYICGVNWYYLNFWWCKIGRFPDFRTCDVDHWQWWRFEVVADPNCYGGLIIKSRREGMTEKALCEGYEYVTRVRGTHFGMQNMTDTDVEKDYERVIKAHEKMIWFFKPVNKGSDKPADGLLFELPSVRMTKGRIDKYYSVDTEMEKGFEAMNSKITFEATKIGKYDGDMLQRYRQGEFGKIPPTTMNIIKRHDVVKPCLHLFNGQKIIGKELWESTVEELGDGEMLERTTQMIRDSDPKKLVDGRTKSGMKYLFRNAIDTAEPDEWGFPKKEETKKFLEAAFLRLEKEQDWEALSDLQRKNPITEEHALTPSVDKCLFNPLKLKKRHYQLQNDFWWNDNTTDFEGNPIKDMRRKGNFVWENGPDTRVVWVDDPNGRWYVSMLLGQGESNLSFMDMSIKVPANKHRFACGCDPIDTKMPDDAGRSNAASTVYAKFNPLVDTNVDEDGKLIIGLMETDQFICTYVARPEEPEMFFEDMIKQCVYYGTEIFYETNKGAGMRNYFRDRGYWGYLMFRPDDTKTSYTVSKDPGAASSELIIGLYIEAIATYVSHKLDNCKHPELIHDGKVGWLTFRNNPKSRGKHDLTVASGFTLLAITKPYDKPPEEVDNAEWFESYKIMEKT